MKSIAIPAAILVAVLLCLSLEEVTANRTDRGGVPADGRHASVLWGGILGTGKTHVDSVYILGGPLDNGDFETGSGIGSWDGWTHQDLSIFYETSWHPDTYQAADLDPETDPNHAWWCGRYWEHDCQTGDFGGYGNNWQEYLDWHGTVAEPLLATTVTVQAVLNYDVEPEYDYLYLEYETAAGWEVQRVFNGAAGGVQVNECFTLDPDDYLGDANDEIHLRWRFSSDFMWSDEDCMWTTLGAAQLDLITVFFDQGTGPELQGTVEDCDDYPVQWFVTLPVGVGDFSHVWPLLLDIDPCTENYTPCVGFIDDGIVVPGTGGYMCTTWCYGPGGYIVNPEGGLAGPDFHLHNEIWSPVIAWPTGDYDGAELRFDVYRHETLGASSPGMFYIWHVRATESSEPSDIATATWVDREYVYYGGPDWFRHHEDVSDLLTPARQHVQVALGVYELGWIWTWNGPDGTPAPYLDNVALVAYQFEGPALSSREIDLAQDNFPEIGSFDYDEPGNNHVRFDMARNIAPSSHLRNDPGDSITCTAVPIRTGSVLADRPKLYYTLDANPLFAAVRTAPTSGWVYGDSIRTAAGIPITGRWSFDLPDSGLLFPGDVLHYYLEAQDDAAGAVGTTLLPADTTGFGDFSSPMIYPRTFTVRALPSFDELIPGDHPDLLFWNDDAGDDGQDKWCWAFNYLGYQAGVHFDIYNTQGPTSGVGNGLGGRATASQLVGYDAIYYTCGDLSVFTLSNGDFATDPSQDAAVLDSWLRQGGKGMFLTGDNLVFDLWINGGWITRNFVNEWLGVAYVAKDIRPLIDQQAAPSVEQINGNPVIYSLDNWIAYGGCPRLNQFDAVLAQPASTQLAEFLDPAGFGDQYSYSAATLKNYPTYDARVVSLPYDFRFIMTPGPNTKVQDRSMAARNEILRDVTLYLGLYVPPPPPGVPAAEQFVVRQYPNPFNPHSRIEYSLPQAGELSIKIFNLRGELVRTLIEELVSAGTGSVNWDSKDDTGSAVASGVYFCQSRALGVTQVHKLTLVR